VYCTVICNVDLKYEMLDHYDFHDFFHTIKSLCVGDFGVKILINILIFGRARRHLNSYAHAVHTHKFLMRMLSACISS
jgi:hypothetical protein